MFEDDVFIENTRLVGGSKTQDLNLRADLVLNMSRGPPGQWFPAIFVGTSLWHCYIVMCRIITTQ